MEDCAGGVTSNGLTPLDRLHLRTTLRKFLDWRAEPGWHEAFDVTPAQWAEGFPEKNWVNERALQLLREVKS